MKGIINRILGKTKFDTIVKQTTVNQQASLFHAMCDTMNIRCDTTENASEIPQTGPLVVVANHPTGIADAILLASLVLSVRKDVRIV